MQHFFFDLGWKKLAVILVGVGVLLLTIIVLSLRTGKSQRNQSQATLLQKQTITITPVTPTSIHPNIPTNTPQEIKTYKNNGIQFSYPSEWSLTEHKTLVTNGQTVEVNAVGKGNFTIDIVNENQIPPDTIDNVFAQQGYQIMIFNNAQKLYRKSIDTNGTRNQLIAVFAQKGQEYLVSYTYQDSFSNGLPTFNAFLKSIQFN